MSKTPYDVAALLREIQASGSKLSLENDEDRRQCLAAARSLSYALETPLDSIFRLCYAEPPHQAAIRIGIDIGLFIKLDQGFSRPMRTSELAENTGTDPVLLARLLKHLAAMGTIYEVRADEFLPTPLSKALVQPIYRDGIPLCANVFGPAVQALPLFLSKTKYRNPTNATDSPFNLAFNTKEPGFAWMAQRPELLAQFNNHMAGTHIGISSWMESKFYPFEENLVKGSAVDEDAVFFVDVGGSKGHDLQELCRLYPNLPRKFVLQDLPGVIKEVSGLDPRIKPMAHDFFTPQPVADAKAYFLHRVLHDWPDANCQVILANIKAVMKRGYSKLLINEKVIPNEGADMSSTGLDIIMMSVLAACERTESDWKTLLESSGFKIIKIWHVEPTSESLIEAEIL